MTSLRTALLALLVAASATHAEVKAAASDNLLLSYASRLDASPASVYAAMGTIERWWSGEHTYSGSAASLSLQLQAGACFCERWSDGSVEHGRVLIGNRGRLDFPGEKGSGSTNRA